MIAGGGIAEDVNHAIKQGSASPWKERQVATGDRGLAHREAPGRYSRRLWTAAGGRASHPACLQRWLRTAAFTGRGLGSNVRNSDVRLPAPALRATPLPISNIMDARRRPCSGLPGQGILGPDLLDQREQRIILGKAKRGSHTGRHSALRLGRWVCPRA